VLYGANGVGKSTYSQLIAKDFNLNHLSSGDEIRKIIKGETPANFDKSLIKNVKQLVNKGALVSDDIVFSIITEKLKEPASKNGVILDGFPRTES